MKTNGMLKKAFAVVLSTATIISCLAGALSASAETVCTIKETYENYFDNENGAEGTEASNYKSVDDIYSYYDFAPSAYNGTKVTRKSSSINITYGGSFNAEPMFEEGGNYGKDSDGAMLLEYKWGAVQKSGQYPRFRIWNNKSSKKLFENTAKPGQLIDASNDNTIYRISFDYKVESPNGYKGWLNYFNGQNSQYFSNNLADSELTPLVRVEDTNNLWKNSGYIYVKGKQWMVASICLKMDENEKAAETAVYIDNLKVDVIDGLVLLEDLVTLTFKDGNDIIDTVKSAPGLNWFVNTPTKAGYKFTGWVDEKGNKVENNSTVTPTEDTTYYATWQVDGYKITETYENYFDNEIGAEGTEAANYKSIDDIYSYYDFAPSAYNGTKVTRKSSRINITNGGSFNAEPMFEEGGNYGKDSDGAMLLEYKWGAVQKSGQYARFRIWNNKSSKKLFENTAKPGQLIEASNDNTIYRISFDYKVVSKNGYKGWLNYFNGQGQEYFTGELSDSVLTPLVRVEDTNNLWKNSGYIYVKGKQWMVASICLKMDKDNEAQQTSVYIDNLKVEVTDATSLDELTTVTFMDGDNELQTIKGLAGLDYTVEQPTKYGYEFAGWTDADGNQAQFIGIILPENTTYYAKWNFVLLNIKGDLNGDNYVNICDLVRLKKYSAGIAGATVIEDNAFLSDYEGEAYRLTAMRKFLLSDEWAYSNAIQPAKKKLADTGNYLCVWNDEFSGNGIDLSKWQIISDYTDTDTITYSSDSDVLSVSDGKLIMQTVKNGETYKIPRGLTTVGTMNYRYGYVEMKAKIPFKGQSGSRPAFWLKTINGAAVGSTPSVFKPTNYCKNYLAEIDVFENSSYWNNSITPNIHKWYTGTDQIDYNATKASDQYKYTFNEADTDEHIFGFEWDAEKMIMSVDGDEYATFDLNMELNHKDHNDDMRGFRDAAYLLLGNGINLTGDRSIDESVLPSAMKIDWIRLFQPIDGIEVYTK